MMTNGSVRIPETKANNRRLRCLNWLALTTLVAGAPSAALAARGGPDALGWAWADSDEPGVDTSFEAPTGFTPLAAPMPDEGVFPVPIAFPFTLYTQTSNTLYVSSNGWISTRATTFPVPTNTDLPDPSSPNATLAFLWDDLDDVGGGSFIQQGPTANGHLFLVRQFIKATGEMIQAYVQFYDNGSVKVIYQTPPNVSSATIGIESDLGGTGLRVAYNGAVSGGANLRDSYAILFYPAQIASCGSATPIACATPTAGTTVGGTTATSSYGCTAGSYTGNERIYQVTVPALAQLDAAITGLGARNLDVFLLRQGCDGLIDCVAGGGDTIAPTLVEPGTYYLLIDGLTPADDGAFTLTLGCSAAGSPIACNSTVSDVLAPGTGSIDSYDCWNIATWSGPERIWNFSLASPQTVTASLTPANPFDLFLLDQTGVQPVTSSCLKGNASDVGYLNLPAGNYALIVDGLSGASGAYDLRLDCQPGVPAIPITCGQVDVRSANTSSSLIDMYPGCDANRRSQGEIFYRFQPAQRVVARASVTDTIDYAAYLFAESTIPNMCLAGGTPVINAGNLSVGTDFIFAVDSENRTGANGLTLTCTPMSTTDIRCGDVLAGVTPLTGATDGYTCLGGSHAGGETWFLFDNPTGQPFSAALTGVAPTSNLDVAIIAGAFDASAPACISGGDNIANVPSPAPGEYLVVVDGDGASSGTAFNLELRCGTQALGCATATPLACGDTVVGDTATGTDATWVYGNVDEFFNGPDKVYHFTATPTVGAVRFVLDAASDARLDLILLDGCDPSNVVAWGDTSIAVPALPPGDYYLVVDATDGVAGSFQLSVECSILDCAAAAPLTCSVATSGDTATGTDLSWLYSGCSPDIFDGREIVYSFTNPVQQTVSFLYQGSPDLSLFLVPGACDPGGCLRFRDGRLIARNLPAGNYFLVVDARNGMTGSFTITPICDNRMIPPDATWVLDPGTTAHQIAEVTFSSCDPPIGDVVFSMDTTGSMGGAIANLQVTSQAIITGLSGLITDVQFGLTSYKDYDGTFTSCGYTGSYGGGGDFPYRRELAITNNLPALFTAIGSLTASGGSDGPESYVRALYELYADLAIGWRPGSKRVAIIFGDNQPHSCATTMCAVPRTSTGIDPGRDNLTGTADDLDLAVVLANLAAQGITPVFLVTGNLGMLPEWECWMPMAGGQAWFSADGAAPPDLLDNIVNVIEAQALHCDALAVQVTPPAYAGWVTNITPAPPVLNVDLPGVFTFEFDVGPPPGTPPGTYVFTIEVGCDGDCALTHEVTIIVPAPCVLDLQYVAPQPVCAGDAVTVDASASTQTGCSTALEFQLRDGGTVLRPWDPAPILGPFVPAASATWTVDARCPTAPTCIASANFPVDVVPQPIAAAGSDVAVCVGEPALLDASATVDLGCPAGGLVYEWRQGATVVRPAAASPTWVPPTGAPGSSTYTVVARCAVNPGCESADDVVVDVVAPPVASAGPDENVCDMVALTLSAAGSTDLGCPGGLIYEWRQGATVVRPFSAIATWNPPTTMVGSTTYTVVARCASSPSCESQDAVTVQVRLCSLAVHFDVVEATSRRDPADPSVDVHWRTSSEVGTTVFTVERGSGRDGEFVAIGEPVSAVGPGWDYHFHDTGLTPGSAPWYRIVEWTVDGRGDVSPAVQAEPESPKRGGGGRNRGSRRR